MQDINSILSKIHPEQIVVESKYSDVAARGRSEYALPPDAPLHHLVIAYDVS